MISVIVCTYNRAAVLRDMLESYFRQTPQDWAEHELIVVDNNSTDDTARVVGEFEGRFGVRYVRHKIQGLSHARNRGLAEARGDYVAFLDDDVAVDEGWRRALLAGIRETNADVICGRVYLKFMQTPPPWLGPFLRPYLAELELGPARLRLKDGLQARGCNVAFRKERVLQLGGFDASLGRIGARLLAGEETRLADRIAQAGGAVIYEPAMVVGHIIGPERMTWEYFRQVYDGLGRTLARNEPWGGSARQMGRIAWSLLHYVLCSGRAALALAVMPPDGRQLTQCQKTRSASILKERWRILKRGGLGKGQE